LQALELVDLLQAQFGSVLVPPTVAAELAKPAEVVGPFDVTLFPFIHVQRATKTPPVFTVKLGAGEEEAIALALEVGADALLIDESTGRAAARRLGLKTTGVLKMLVHAKWSGRVIAVTPLLAKLESTIKFRMSRPLRERILRDAGEI
jgi:uncharacterized protein